MKCLVCGKTFENNECPRCGFPVVESPNAASLQAMLEGPARTYRASFWKEWEISVPVQCWQEQDGALVPGVETPLPLGSAAALRDGPLTLPTLLSRLPEAEELQVPLQFSCKRTGWTERHTLTLPNIQAPGLQHLTARAEGEDALRLYLHSEDADRTTQSAPLALLAE